MTKQEKRITELEKEVKELREQVLQLAMQLVYVPYQTSAVSPFQPPYSIYPNYTIACGGCGGSDAQGTGGMISGAQSGNITYSVDNGPSFQGRQNN